MPTFNLIKGISTFLAAAVASMTKKLSSHRSAVLLYLGVGRSLYGLMPEIQVVKLNNIMSSVVLEHLWVAREGWVWSKRN